jgi:hypothetical protein
MGAGVIVQESNKGDHMGALARYRAHADRRLDHMEAHPRVPLTASQHILHLLLTVFTCGLWAPVWIIRAHRGNPMPVSSRPASG